MVKELIFYILDIPETKNKETITSAYRTNLKKHNPEDDPEGFKRLRQAYEAALDFANQTDEDLEEANRFPMAYQTPKHKKHNKNDNPEEVAMDLWMSRIIKVYEDLTLRRDEEEWKSILNDPICQDLDTSLEAQNRIMNFFTDAFHLPHNIWALVDQTFQIKKNQETLKEYYPPKFLNYICYYIENEDFLPFALFEYTNENEKNTNADSYIELLLSLHKQADARLLDHCRETLENIKAYGIYHPFEDVGRLRLYIYEESPEKIPDLLDSLYPRYKDYDYISLYVGEGRWLLGDIEGAYEIWSHILENDPNFYAAKYNKLRYLCEKKDFYHAKLLATELIEISETDNRVMDMLTPINEALITEYRDLLENDKEHPHLSKRELTFDFIWCLFQNKHIEEASKYISELQPCDEQDYDYFNLCGKFYVYQEEYEKALPLITRWMEIIESLKDDGTKETKKRMSRLGSSYYYLGNCYCETGKIEEGFAFFEKALGTITKHVELLHCYHSYASVLLDIKEYEKVVDLCDKML